MSSLVDLSAVELLAQLQSGKTSSVEIVRAYLDRIRQLDPQIGAFLHVRDEAALQEAEQIDRRRSAGETLGCLGGLPVAVKDVLCTKDEPTTCASKMLEHFKPPYNATVIERLQAADGVIIGKTNMDEFAMGSANENSALQATRNPWDTTRTPGGSSGGSAACVAAKMAPLAIGSDTGGSIRQPAAFCGVVGMKPTYGRVSRYGLVAFASSLDQVGPFGRTVEDTALLLEAIAGHDPRDSTSIDAPAAKYFDLVSQPLEKMTIGIPQEYFDEGLDSEIADAVRKAAEVYRSLGAAIEEISLPHSRYGVAAYYIIAPCEASSNLARYDGVHYGYRTDEKVLRQEYEEERKRYQKEGNQKAIDKMESLLVRMYRKTRAEGFGPEVKRRVMLGTYALSRGYYDQFYVKALKVRRLIRNDYDAAFQKVDFILGPTTPTPAYKLGEKAGDLLATYLDDLYTVSANLAGITGISLPCGKTAEGLPIGLQLQAAPLQEAKLLQAAAMFQNAEGASLE